MKNPVLIPVAFALVLPLFSPCRSLEAQDRGLFQELTLSGVMARSTHPEFPDPWGIGGVAAWDFQRHWRLRLSFLRLWDDSEKMGQVCVVYAPNIGCVPSMTFNDVTLSSFRGAILRTKVLIPGLRMGIGGGLSFNDVNARSVGENGMNADLLVPNSGHIGYLAMASAQWIPPLPLPIRLTTSLTEHWVDFNICSGEDPPQYDPFCDAGRFTELEAGLSLVF